jgi:hypothetical protein
MYFLIPADPVMVVVGPRQCVSEKTFAVRHLLRFRRRKLLVLLA